MTKAYKINRIFFIVAIYIGLIACASTAEIDTRPALIQSAEKSLELGVSNYNENNFTKAESHFDRALFLYRSIDNPEGITTSCLNIAKTKLSSGQINQAHLYAERAKNIIQREQLKQFDDLLALIQSSIAIDNNDTTKAKPLLDGLLAETQSNGNHAIRTAALQNRTRIAFLDNTNPVDWVKLYEDALKKPGQNSILNKARLLRFKAELEINNQSASANFAKALMHYRSTAHSPGIAATLAEWAKLDISNADYKSALSKLERALYIRTTIHDRRNSQKVLQLLGTSYNKLSENSRSERASYWQNKLDNKTFEEWEALRLEFETYPR